MMQTRLLCCWVEVISLNPTQVLWIIGIELRLPELEGNRDPGKQLSIELAEFHDLGRRIDRYSDQPGRHDMIKQGIIDDPDIVLLKALSSPVREKKGRGSQCPAMMIACANAAIIQAHLTVIKCDGSPHRLERIPQSQSGIGPSLRQLLRNPV